MICHKCGLPATAIEVAREGAVVASGALCPPCLDVALERSRVLDLEFRWLLENGVDRAAANRFLISKIDGAPSS